MRGLSSIYQVGFTVDSATAAATLMKGQIDAEEVDN